MKPYSVGELASHLGGTVRGDASAVVTHPAGLQEADEGALTFLANRKYAAHLAKTRATAAVVGVEVEEAPCALIRVDNPDLAFGEAVSLMAGPPPRPPAGIHPAAVIDPTATLGADVAIGPGCIVAPGAVVGEGCALHGNVHLGHGARLGEGCVLHPGVALYHDVVLGARVVVHAGTVIGSDGFGYAWDGSRHVKIPQVGTVEIGDDVEIGANCTIDRARFGATVIGPGTKIDNLVQLAHNVRVGAHAILVSQVGVSGSTTLGNGVVVGGQVGFSGHLNIGDRAMFTAQSGVNKNIAAGEHVSGTPGVPHKVFLDGLRHLKALPRVRASLKDLEERIERLEQATDSRE